jgi:hypothetical protein
MKRLKSTGEAAPGLDGLPDAFLSAVARAEDAKRRAALAPAGRAAPSRFRTAAGRALERAANLFYADPAACAAANVGVIHPIPKRGAEGSLAPDDFRPITVIEAVPKLVSRAAAGRLGPLLEGRLSPAQAAFRGKEGCPGQVLSLLEVASSRFSRLGRPTYVAFLDLKQAFDTVPHAEILAALARAGAPPDLLRFVRGLYASSTARVKFHRCLSADAFRSARGIRQGDPLSPFFFFFFF